MAPSHEPYFTMRGYMSKQDSHDLKAIWSGPHRVIVSIISGFRNGPDFEAEILPDGGDCILVSTFAWLQTISRETLMLAA